VGHEASSLDTSQEKEGRWMAVEDCKVNRCMLERVGVESRCVGGFKSSVGDRLKLVRGMSEEIYMAKL